MFAQTADQHLFEKTTAGFLAAAYPTDRLRELARRPEGFDATAWRRGAELGWTTLLVPEALGGGAISEHGMLDLPIVAYQFGWQAAPGPLLGTNVVAAALARWGTAQLATDVVGQLCTGSATGAWAYAADVRAKPPADGDAATVRLDGTVPCVEGVADADFLLVGAGTGAERCLYLVDTSAPGIAVADRAGLDLTRRFSDVVLHDVAVPSGARIGVPGTAHGHEAALLDLASVVQAAEIVGAVHRAFDLTLQWTRDRYSFGRPLASYQEIKHRIADLRTDLEAAAATVTKAAHALASGAPDAGSWAAAAKAFAGQRGPEVIQDCIQLHGGIGVTYEHDLHILLRRATIDAKILGTPADARQRLVALLEEGAGR